MVERWPVEPDVAGSNPVSYPRGLDVAPSIFTGKISRIN